MSSIRGKNTKPELKVRRWLHGKGFRYSVHSKAYPGKPDLVLRKHKAVIFVHGCFWHRHKNCKLASNPKSRVEFWTEKFQKNTNRDKSNYDLLLKDRWRVAIVWECETRSKDFEQMMSQLANWIASKEIWYESTP